MLHRTLALVGYPAHLLNRLLAGALGRIGVGRVPGALLVGLALAVRAGTTAMSTLQAYGERPEPQAATIGEVADGGVTSGLWIVFDGIRIDGPHTATVEIFAGSREPRTEARTYYLVADPSAPARALVVRSREPVAELGAADGPVRIDGTITEDQFNMRGLLAEWDVATRHPGVQLSESRLVAYAFATPWVEPSWIGAILLGLATAVILVGAFVTQPVLRPTAARAPSSARARTPIELAIHGELPTPRGPVRLHGTPARLAWMNVEEVARTRWRYWGAALGDVRGEVEDAVRAHGPAAERLVIHGPSGSVIFPIEDSKDLELQAGEAYLGPRRLPAIRIRGSGAAATLTFADEASRDAAHTELGGDPRS